MSSSALASSTTSEDVSTPVLASSSVRNPIRNLEGYGMFAMNQYAEAGEGMIFRCRPDCLLDDFAYYPHKRTARERRRWKKSLKSQRRIRHLSSKDKLLLQSIHIPAERDLIRSSHNKHVDVRISEVQFSRLEQLVVPGTSIWVLNAEDSIVLRIPSHVLSFTDEEKEKYHGNKFKEDGSDLPTLKELTERYQHSGEKELQELERINDGGYTLDELDELVGQKGSSHVCVLL